MKAKHRHELKTNELAQWLENFPQWARDNMRMIIYISIVVLLVVISFGYKFYTKNVTQSKEKRQLLTYLARSSTFKGNIIKAHSTEGSSDVAYNLLDLAKRLGAFAQNAKNPDVAAMALIEQGELYRTEPHYRREIVNKGSISKQIANARKAYEKALEKAIDNPTLQANAKYGLGMCEEELGNFPKAREVYQEIVDDVNFTGTVAVIAAKNRLEIMDEYTKVVTFLPPKPKPVDVQDNLNIPDIIDGGITIGAPNTVPVNIPAVQQ